MSFIDRAHVENTGRFGVYSERDENGLRAKQLNSFWLYVDEEDAGYTKHALGDGFWESWITLWMDRNVAPDATSIDIGANHGYYSLFLASRGGTVFAFEPQTRLAKLIKKSVDYSELPVDVRQIAISDREGEVEMMVPIHHGMNATISNQFSYAPDGYTNIKVNTWALDDMDGLPEIDFIKVDAEGAEDLIWNGSAKFRERHPDCVWLMEWRWDRYTNPAEFGQKLFDDYDVTAVDTAGYESNVFGVKHLETVQHEDWMLVLRKKSNG